MTNATGYAARIKKQADAKAKERAIKEDLLEALVLVRMSAGWQYMSPETRKIIDAAITKATGQ